MIYLDLLEIILVPLGVLSALFAVVLHALNIVEAIYRIKRLRKDK